MSAYEQTVKGSLKLKGEGILKKKKKKKDKKLLEALENAEAESSVPVRTKTAAELKYEAVQKKRQQEKIAQAATRSHKEKVAEFNAKLESLSEHYDIPKTFPPPSEQLLAIGALINSALEIGETRYLVDTKWFNEWQRYVTCDSPVPPGPIDNTSLFKDESCTSLRDWLSVDVDAIPIPQEAWEKLVLWYDSSTPEIARPVIKGSAQNAVIEVYPWEVSLVRILPPSSNIPKSEIPKVRISKGCTLADLRSKVIDTLKINGDMKLWKFNEDKPDTAFITSNQLKNNARLIVTDLNNKTILEFGLYLYDTIGVETKITHHLVLAFAFTLAFTFTLALAVAHDQTQLSDQKAQRNTPDLKEYFLTSLYEKELNSTNPLGMQGEVAKAFGNLMKKLWSEEYNCVIPRDFKSTVSRFAPAFMGYQQHDSQEFIAFLLDGLHEDLNRIYDKPYIEKMDSDGRPDALVAEEHWKLHKARNDSIIVDMFQGQFKSTLVCPECDKVSVTFDPFMYLTLPVPISKDLKLQIHFIPLDPSKRPLKLNLRMPYEATHRSLKEKLGAMLNVSSQNLASCEIYSARIYKVFENLEKLSEIETEDGIYVYELPVSFPPSVHSGYVILPVLLAYSLPMSIPSSCNVSSFFGFPLMVALPEDQISETALELAVMEQLSRYTTVDLDFLDPAEFPGEPEDLIDNVEQTHIEIEYMCNDDNNPPMASEEAASSKLFEMKVNSQTSALGIPNNFMLNSLTSLSKRRQRISEANDDQQKSLLSYGDTIVCQWKREVADYVFKANNRAKSAEVVHSGFRGAFETYQNPAEPTTPEVKKNPLISLYDCLGEFVREERLGEEDPWYCPSCKKHQQAWKKFDLWRMPDILVVHLKRFSNLRSWRNKIDALVDFPIRGLDLSSHVLPENTKTEQKQWYNFDDAKVEPVNECALKTSAAYLLFYRRRDAVSHIPGVQIK
ncbi:cysteine proteinase [Basidiobolus meristosporus CBS 931.73]|uniref:ubiquitinyl hydrolase 1 n=1 Tax=Basidiobolus meristosporus CBS 931.73 TaxID=1314790 RepID=A0A1Y1Y4P8_9FUNG|nr:cysteine proteinase [Basidiobolus meristosporus CBS 931.73]|eukprot:ORX93001.1 cysteine proteinase [Basidiobolus meristosporus CBS 931.73]